MMYRKIPKTAFRNSLKIQILKKDSRTTKRMKNETANSLHFSADLKIITFLMAGRLTSDGGTTTLPGQGENPFIFAHTGSPTRNLCCTS
jgi:hypothetical protein